MSGVTQVGFWRPSERGETPRRPLTGTSSVREGAVESLAPRGELERVQSTPPKRPAGRWLARGKSNRRRSGLRLARWTLAGVAAAVIGAMVAGASVIAVVCVVMLVCAAVLLGWRLGEDARTELEQEIEGRDSELKRALSELEIAQAETVRRLSMAVEFRDADTGAHIERIGRFSMLLAEQIGMDPDFCAKLRYAAPLHDVGKVAIPDAILLKPGPLTPQERAIVETHAEEGHRLVRGSSSSILDLAATIALSHQEKWDGSGYPRGLVGEEIPIEGRIVAVVDVFDALTSDRVYRKAFPVEEALRMMRRERGRHFDPVLFDAFMEVLDRYGPDTRKQARADPLALLETTLQTYATALERGDAETAEGAIATAVEDGIPPSTVHGEVIVPALRRMGELYQSGEVNADCELLARSITRRVLATLYRYMLGGTESTRERVLLAGVEGDEHTLELQMVHDQLAAAGYRTIFDTDLSIERLRAMVESESPDLIVLGGPVAGAEAVELVVRDLRASHPHIPIVLGGAAVGVGLPRERVGMRMLERIDESVETVEGLLAARTSVPSI
jgi:methanogenic corrinoid protein MtbC1